MPKSESSEPPNFAVPKFLARQTIQILRACHLVCDEWERVFPLLPADQKILYAHLAGIKLQPAFIDIMQIIALSEERGTLSPEEAATLRAGRYIDNPLPDEELKA